MAILKLNIENKGLKQGTLGWLLDYLKEANLEIGQTERNEPCVTMNGKLICYTPKPKDMGWGYNGYLKGKDMDVYHVHAVHEKNNPDDIGVFDYLTPAAEEAIEEVIYECAWLLRDVIEKDGQGRSLEVSVNII